MPDDAGPNDAWFGSGGGAVLTDLPLPRRGPALWSVHVHRPSSSSASGGVFGLAFRTPFLGVAVGGDFNAPAAEHATSRQYSLFGSSRGSTPPTEPSGYRSGITFVPYTLVDGDLAVGLTGSDISYDGGRHWTAVDTGQFDTVSCATDGACWASGDLGRVAVFNR